jgi:ABC-type transporter Mla subunit MlaD
VLKWLYFALVAAFLAAVLWMINDLRLGVNGLLDRLDRQLPSILNNTEQAAQRLNNQLPRLLKTSEQAAQDINSHLPVILKNTGQATKDINTHLPQLLTKAEQGVNQLTELAKSFREFKELFTSLDPPAGPRGRVRLASDRPLRVEGRNGSVPGHD